MLQSAHFKKKYIYMRPKAAAAQQSTPQSLKTELILESFFFFKLVVKAFYTPDASFLLLLTITRTAVWPFSHFNWLETKIAENNVFIFLFFLQKILHRRKEIHLILMCWYQSARSAPYCSTTSGSLSSEAQTLPSALAPVQKPVARLLVCANAR